EKEDAMTLKQGAERSVNAGTLVTRRRLTAMRVAIGLLLPLLLLSTRAARADEQGEDGQWTMPGKNYQLTRYSGLDQINTDNAKNLQVAWTFSTGVNRGHEAPPIVVGKTMYVVTPFPNLLYALDLEKAAQKDNPLKWKYEPKPESAAQGVACCDLVNRGCFYDEGKIYFNALDVNACCVDADTGKESWK